MKGRIKKPTLGILCFTCGIVIKKKKNLPANAGDAEDRVQSLGQEDPLK